VCHERTIVMLSQRWEWPPDVGLQEQDSNRPALLRSKDAVVNDRGFRLLACRCGLLRPQDHETSRSSPTSPSKMFL
jgi:hypothetical protein